MQRRTCEIRQDEKKFAAVTTPRALSILRVSTDKQMRDGDGIENQRRANDAYIRRKQYELVKTFEIAESASHEVRKEFDAVFDYTVANRNKVDVWVMYKVDRLSRGGLLTYAVLKQKLKELGIRIEYSTQEMDGETPEGELMEGMLAIMARFENRLKTQRTIGVEKILTKEGYWCRAAPTGFVNARDEKGKPILKPTPDKGQWDLLCYGLKKQMMGVYTVVEVAEELAVKGLRTKPMIRKGVRMQKLMTKQTWMKIVRNPIYGGLIREQWTDEQFVRAKFDGPLSPDEWKALQDALDGRKKVMMPPSRRKHHADFPLRRFLLCPVCGDKVRGSRSTGKLKKPYWYYHCKNKACRFCVQTKNIHPLFEDYLRKITPSPELVNLFREVVLEAFAERHKHAASGVTEAEKELKAIRDEKQTLIRLMKDAANSPELLKDLKEQYEGICRRYSLANAARGERVMEEVQADVVVDYCVHFLLHAHKLWKEAQPEEQFRLQSLIFPEGISYDALTGRQTPKLSPVYEAISDLKKGDNQMAASRGIEPRLQE